MPGIPLDFLQSREPKLRADTLAPVDWPADPELEWCPPGHGDLYVSLARLRHARRRCWTPGIDWAFVSNSDNLGAEVDARIPAWADADDVPFVMEVVRGTAADRKGGHIARRRADGRVVLRETAQAPPGDDSFTDVERWRFYNTNNLWVDLRALRRLLDDDPAGPALPLIVNRKTVDPRDRVEPAGPPAGDRDGRGDRRDRRAPAPCSSPARASPRSRRPTTCCVVRSDAYALDDDGHVCPHLRRPAAGRRARPRVLQVAGGHGTALPPRPAVAARRAQPHRARRRHVRRNVQIVGDGSVTGRRSADGRIIEP